jgi:hypothetical protein
LEQQRFYVQLLCWSFNFVSQVAATTTLSNINFMTTAALQSLGQGGYTESRQVLTMLSQPSIETQVRPAVFIDLTQSFPHGSSCMDYNGMNSNVDVTELNSYYTGTASTTYFPGVTEKTILNLLAVVQRFPGQTGGPNTGGFLQGMHAANTAAVSTGPGVGLAMPRHAANVMNGLQNESIVPPNGFVPASNSTV